MEARRLCLALLIGAAAVTVGRSGHELPVYPSYYPHEIEIRTVSPERAAVLLVEGRLHAYVGREAHFPASPPDTLRTVESLGSFIVVRVNPSSAHAQDDQSRCTVARTVSRAVAASRGDLIVHPYPVTPLHGDYLHHVDLAEAAKTSLLADSADGPTTAPKVKADGLAASLVPLEWKASGAEWDAEIAEVMTDDVVARAKISTNGWQGPSAIRTGWLHAQLLLGDAAGDALGPAINRLQADELPLVERINLQRDLIAGLTAGCRAIVAGYRVRREFVNADFSAGIENIGFDALSGLNSPMFLRTVKLKDFPWNGWLSVAMDDRPMAAWNPIAGFSDRFGQLMWSAVGDPAAIPSPYDSTWMLNRVSDVEGSAKR